MVLMNQTPVSSDLDGMLSLCPVEVVDDVVQRNAGNGGAGFCGCLRHESEVDVVAGPYTDVAEPLTDITIPDVVNEVRPDRPGIAGGKPFAVVLDYVCGTLSGELFRVVGDVLLEIAANENPMLIVGRIVEPCD